jgi:hypothetical protein
LLRLKLMREVVFLGDAFDKGGDEFDGAVHVGEVAHFDDAVHVAEGVADQSAGDAFFDVEDHVGIGAAVAAAAFMLEGDVALIGDFHDALHHVWVIARAVGDAGAGAEFDFAVDGVVDAGSVGGMGDVEDDRDIGHEAVSDHFRAVPADFLLHGVHGDDGAAGRVLGETGEHLSDDETAEAVIEGAADQAIHPKLLDAVAIDGGMADAEPEVFYFFLSAGADIDVEFVDLRDLFIAEVVFAEVDRGITHDAADDALVAEEVQAAAARRGGVAPADPIDAEKTFLGDVLDDEANLVGVGFDHDALGLFGCALERRPGGAVGIVLDAIGEFAGVLCPHALAGHFESCGAGSAQEFEEESFSFGVHGGVHTRWPARAQAGDRGLDYGGMGAVAATPGRWRKGAVTEVCYID